MAHYERGFAYGREFLPPGLVSISCRAVWMKQASARVADPIMCKSTCAILPQVAQSLIFRSSEAYIKTRGFHRGRG